jgi:catechol 2,3-dioxygenase-like lactoylglutathione lyase family enzyme
MARGLDHIVHAVRDLDAAVELYRGLGFQVGARNRHPPSWGTQNHIIQLPGTFIELLAVANASGIAPHSSRHFSFGAFNRDFLVHEQGLSMLVLEGHGTADADGFRAEGIGDFELYEFEREGKRPDGMAIPVASALYSFTTLPAESSTVTCAPTRGFPCPSTTRRISLIGVFSAAAVASFTASAAATA